MVFAQGNSSLKLYVTRSITHIPVPKSAINPKLGQVTTIFSNLSQMNVRMACRAWDVQYGQTLRTKGFVAVFAATHRETALALFAK